MKCRSCSHSLSHVFVDLVNSPPSNSFLKESELNSPEVFYPLRLFVCERCWLVQIDEYKKSQEIFSKEYIYFSSYSKTWLEHARKYVESMCERFSIGSSSQVVEIAANDGYLLQYFLQKNIPVLGIEPTHSTARVAMDKGIPIVEDFFGSQLAQKLSMERKQADLIVANNVLAHVPDVMDFVRGIQLLLKPTGIATIEFPHLLELVENNQFDTIYHEHFSYFSFIAVNRIFEKCGLEIFDVEQLPTHGGSLRIFAQHQENKPHAKTHRVQDLLDLEYKKGLNDISYYSSFQSSINRLKYELLSFLLSSKIGGKKIIGYGAAAKGNTFLSYCGIKNDIISFVVDASPHKQGKYLPASHIPVYSEEKIREYKPDYILILPWNIKEEIMDQLAYAREWGCQFVVAVPQLQVS